jgi:hypothetical protein
LNVFTSTAALLLQPGLDIVEHLSKKSNELDKKNCGQLQPHVVVLSADGTVDNATTFYAIVQGNVFYQVDSVLEAVDTCLKACFVFGLRYPDPSKSSWNFMQKAVFGISTLFDYTNTKLLELLTSVQLN